MIIQVGQAIGVVLDDRAPVARLDPRRDAAALPGPRRVAALQRSARRRAARPAREVVDGALVIFGGALLITPGFITDIFGLLFLLPPTRAVVRAARCVRRHRPRRVVTVAGRAPARRRPPRRRGDYDVEGTAHRGRATPGRGCRDRHRRARGAAARAARALQRRGHVRVRRPARRASTARAARARGRRRRAGWRCCSAAAAGRRAAPRRRERRPLGRLVDAGASARRVEPLRALDVASTATRAASTSRFEALGAPPSSTPTLRRRRRRHGGLRAALPRARAPSASATSGRGRLPRPARPPVGRAGLGAHRARRARLGAWLDDDLGVHARRGAPAEGAEHDDEARRRAGWSLEGDAARARRVDDARLSTTYDGDGRQRRAGLELWPDGDGLPAPRGRRGRVRHVARPRAPAPGLRVLPLADGRPRGRRPLRRPAPRRRRAA